MNISRINQAMEAYRPTQRKPAAAKKAAQGRDEISISSEARLYESEGRLHELAKKAAAAVPDVREDKVASIMKRLENGTYSVSSSALAKKILGE